MTKKTIQVLVAIVVALVLLIVVAERTGDISPAMQDRALLPEFVEQANATQQVRIFTADTDPLVLRQVAGAWVTSARDDYAVDIGKLRALIIALAEARIIEEKTSNAERYEKLGVADPEDGGKGTKIIVDGENFTHAVIFGESAQGNLRYARLADEETSYLVDQNPSIPGTANDWLLTDILDIDSEQVRSVTITHDDGETIAIAKDTEDQIDFTVLDIPQGRELSYAAVANGIAATLSALKFDDVRKAADRPFGTSVLFETWDGLQVTARVLTEDEAAWVAFSAAGAPDKKATDISNRLSGWQYQLPAYKKDLLTRRWDDILKSADAD